MHGVVSLPPADRRTPPQNIELEQALLGAILVNNDAFHRVSDFLEPRHFAEPVHGRIFQICGELIGADRTVGVPDDITAGHRVGVPWRREAA
jgi:replicative DNA helicase